MSLLRFFLPSKLSLPRYYGDVSILSMTLRKALRSHRSFPTDESAMKVIYLAIQNISKKWTMPSRDWKAALNRFALEFEGRFLI